MINLLSPVPRPLRRAVAAGVACLVPAAALAADVVREGVMNAAVSPNAFVQSDDPVLVAIAAHKETSARLELAADRLSEVEALTGLRAFDRSLQGNGGPAAVELQEAVAAFRQASKMESLALERAGRTVPSTVPGAYAHLELIREHLLEGDTDSSQLVPQALQTLQIGLAAAIGLTPVDRGEVLLEDSVALGT